MAGSRQKHGHARKGSKTPTYVAWINMRQRCGNPRRDDWKDYGGRGIVVCVRWRRFENFLADMGERPPGLSIDRIDNDEGYRPSNCQWASKEQQNRNRRIQ